MMSMCLTSLDDGRRWLGHVPGLDTSVVWTLYGDAGPTCRHVVCVVVRAGRALMSESVKT